MDIQPLTHTNEWTNLKQISTFKLSGALSQKFISKHMIAL